MEHLSVYVKVFQCFQRLYKVLSLTAGKLQSQTQGAGVSAREEVASIRFNLKLLNAP